MTTIIGILAACGGVTIKDTRWTAVGLPDDIKNPTNHALQVKHYDALLAIAKEFPFNMQAGSIGFVQYKDNTYLSIGVLAGTYYNTIKTTTGTRLSSEFHQKYKQTVQRFASKGFEADSIGFHVVLNASSYNFVSEGAYAAKPENLELFTTWELIGQFVAGDITAQELVGKSVVFVSGQRSQFTLEYL